VTAHSHYHCNCTRQPKYAQRTTTARDCHNSTHVLKKKKKLTHTKKKQKKKKQTVIVNVIVNVKKKKKNVIVNVIALNLNVNA
jgi:hypothetical protein